MTKDLGNISELRDALNNLYPMVTAYYKIKNVLKRLEEAS